MRIAIIGSGGREHAICHKISQSKNVNKIFCLPGNGGTNKIAKNIDIDIKYRKTLAIFILVESLKGSIINGYSYLLSKKE